MQVHRICCRKNQEVELLSLDSSILVETCDRSEKAHDPSEKANL